VEKTEGKTGTLIDPASWQGKKPGKRGFHVLPTKPDTEKHGVELIPKVVDLISKYSITSMKMKCLKGGLVLVDLFLSVSTRPKALLS